MVITNNIYLVFDLIYLVSFFIKKMNSSPTNKGITENNSLFADVIYRDILSRGIGCIFNDVGFGSVEKKALNTTVHMVANCKCKKPYILSFIIFFSFKWNM